MDKKGSWNLFFMTLGFLCIMFSQNSIHQAMMIIIGFFIIMSSIIYWKKKNKQNTREEHYDKICR